MSSNNISRITGLSELKQLKKLSLVGNELTKIEGLDGLTSLETVQLQGNKLAQLDDAQKLAKLPCLRTLRLHDNPMCEHPAYWSAVRRMLPNLRSLDGEFSTLADAAAVEGDALAEIEYNLAGSASEQLQLGGMVGAFMKARKDIVDTATTTAMVT